MNYIETETRDDTGTLWLNRPEKGNALQPELIREFIAVLKEWEKDAELRYIIIRGRGKHFCAGADLNWMAAAGELSDEENKQESLELAEFFESVYFSGKICIARVHGACYGGGIGLASVCDFTIADDSARFSFGEIRLGLIPATIAPFVAGRIGTTKAKQYMLTGTVLKADEAKSTGLIDELADAAGADKFVNALLANLRQGSPSAQQKIKTLLNSLNNKAYSETLRNETAEIIARARISAEGKEGIRAFLEKRQPKWSNK